MEAPKPDPIILSTSAFKALYNAVSDMVFLYRPSDACIVEGNTAFRKAVGIVHEAVFLLPLSRLMALAPETALAPGQVMETQFFLAYRSAVPVRLQMQALVLEQEPFLLGIASEIIDVDASKKALAAADAEKKLLLKEVYHRVKNNLNVIISLMSLQLNRAQDQQLRHSLTESKSRVYTLALLQERLYHSPRLTEIKANEYLVSLAQSVMATFKESDKPISLLPKTNECWLNVDLLVPLGLILHELVANAVQHAFKDRPSGSIHIQYGYTACGNCQLLVQDNGVGLPEDSSFTSFKSLGAQLVVSLSRQLKGRLEVESSPEKGTMVSLIFSVPIKHAKL